MPLQISGIGSILKKVIIPTIQDQLPKQSVLFDKIKKNSGVTMSNNTIYIACRTGRHSGIYSVTEGTEPGTGSSTYSNPYTSIKYTFGTLVISDQAIEAAKDNAKAIASILTTEIKALTTDFRKDINRQFFGDGSGVLCLTNGTGVPTTTTVTVDEPGTRYLVPGMAVVIGTSTAVAITSVDSSTTFTIPAGAAWPNNSNVKKSNAGTTAEMMGLKGLIDDGDYVGTIQNIDRLGNSWAKSQVEDTAATLTEAHMIDLFLACKEYGSPSVMFMGPNGFSKYGSLLTSMKKTADLKEILSGGWKGLEFITKELHYN